MKEKISKTEAKEKIKEFFDKIKSKSPKEVLKIKKLSMKNRITLGINKKLFCSDCFEPYLGNEKIRITKGFKTVTCEKCGKVKKIKL